MNLLIELYNYFKAYFSKTEKISGTGCMQDESGCDLTDIKPIEISKKYRPYCYSEPYLSGVKAEDMILPTWMANKKVLDVGAGDGFITARMRDELGCDVTAIEPDATVCQALSSRIGQERAFNLTLQQALEQHPQAFTRAFDVVTVLKYNVNPDEKESFIKALNTCLKPEGTLYVTSVELDKFDYDSKIPRPFILSTIKSHFSDVELEEIKLPNYERPNYIELTAKPRL